MKEHFRDPEMVSPGSKMLRINLEEGELEALATFVMGLAKPDISTRQEATKEAPILDSQPDNAFGIRISV